MEKIKKHNYQAHPLSPLQNRFRARLSGGVVPVREPSPAGPRGSSRDPIGTGRSTPVAAVMGPHPSTLAVVAMDGPI